MKSFSSNKNFELLIKTSKDIKKYLSKTEIDKLLFSKEKIKHINQIFNKAFNN